MSAAVEGVFDPARHRALDAEAWSPAAVRAEIDDIAADFASARLDDDSWPTHPIEADHERPLWRQYDGAAGAVVALRVLHEAGYDAPDLARSLPRTHAAWLASDDEAREPGLQLGEIGVLAPAVRAGVADAALVDRLERCMHEIVGHPAREITSGETGMMHAALTLYRATGDRRWAAHYQAGAHSLFEAWQCDALTGQWLWTSDVFGSTRRYYGACHGVAGNAGALLRGADLLPAEWVDTIIERVVATLVAGAIRDGDDLGWPVSADPSGTRRLMQWCHGAAGVVVALADAPRREGEAARALDTLLLRAGETVWRAGPVAKGPGICHGTAGNGYALLALYRRTGERTWLERARAFAMHGIGQRRRGLARHGQGKYTLWTGDGGFAVYLHHCLLQGDEPEASPFPGLELF